MAKGTVNKVILIGRCGSDIEMRYTPSGKNFARLSLATTRCWKNDFGSWESSTDWHRVVLWGQRAELARMYLAKGDRVYVEGRLQTRQWLDREGIKRYTTEVVGSTLEMLGSSRQQSHSESLDTAAESDALPSETEEDVPF